LAVWEGRVSPVFDTSRRMLVLEVEGGQVRSRKELEIDGDDAFLKTSRLGELGISTLICGAVSVPLAQWIAARGIRLIPFVAGGVEEVVAAFLVGALPNPALTLPGCRGRRFGSGRGVPCRWRWRGAWRKW